MDQEFEHGRQLSQKRENRVLEIYTRILENQVLELRAEVRRLKTNGDEAGAHPESTTPRRQHTDRDGVSDLLTLGYFQSPSYLGPASGISIAFDLGGMAPGMRYDKGVPRMDDSNPHSESEGDFTSRHSHENLGNGSVTHDGIQKSKAAPPTNEQGAQMIRAYISKLHFRYPYLDVLELWGLHQDRVRLADTKTSELSKADRLGVFKLYMIYATGAKLLHLTGKRSFPSAERYYMTGIQHFTDAHQNSRSINSVEALTMLVIYHLRSGSYYGIWYVIGLAMRTCVDLGLHRQSHERDMSYKTIQQRRRLFWTVYSLERAISIAMGRPSSIRDAHIDMPFPDEVVDSTTCPISPETPTQASMNAQSVMNTSQAVDLFRLRRVESKIHDSIYRPNKPLQSLLPKMQRLYTELESLHSEIEAKLAPQSAGYDYTMLYYNRALRLLLQPFLSLLTKSDPFYHRCLRAAGEICQIHKRLNQTSNYGHSFVALQTVFVAGITLLYCLWTQGKDLWSVKLSNDVRACSSVLFVMGERASYVKKYRDAFEVLLNTTMEKLENDVSPQQGLMECVGPQFAKSKQPIRTTQDEQPPRDYDTNSATSIYVLSDTSHGHAQTASRIPLIASTHVIEGLDISAASLTSSMPMPDGFAQLPTSGGDWQYRDLSSDSTFGEMDYQNNETLRVVSEVATWMDQDQDSESREVWMPDFDILEGRNTLWPSSAF